MNGGGCVNEEEAKTQIAVNLTWHVVLLTKRYLFLVQRVYQIRHMQHNHSHVLSSETKKIKCLTNVFGLHISEIHQLNSIYRIQYEHVHWVVIQFIFIILNWRCSEKITTQIKQKMVWT